MEVLQARSQVLWHRRSGRWRDFYSRRSFELGMVLEMREWEGRRNLFRHPKSSMRKVERLVWFRSDKFLESDLVPRQWEESKDLEQVRSLAILVKLNVARWQ